MNSDIDIKNIENIATKTATHFKLDYVGVDLMMGNDNEWKVLEVNRACQFKGFEKSHWSKRGKRSYSNIARSPDFPFLVLISSYSPCFVS